MYNDFKYKQKRKHLRKDQTDVEKILWSKLRSKQVNGKKFYRQYSIGSYIVDFYCFQNKLAIELDGGQHNSGEQLSHDNKRTSFLQKQGIKVLRFWNNEIHSNLDNVISIIYEHVK